jgi:hypothetical protein
MNEIEVREPVKVNMDLVKEWFNHPVTKTAGLVVVAYALSTYVREFVLDRGAEILGLVLDDED